MLFSKKIKSYCYTESGRSMIEMLGVLAIVGVLSIAGIAGYEFAVLKFRVNEIINELNGRAISISSLLLNDKHTYAPEEVIEDGFGDTLSIGYGVESGISERNSNYFEISVMNVPSDVCVQLLKSYENPIMIFADDVSYNNDTSICQNESGVVDMSFIYRNDLGEHDKCSARGYFGEEDFKCHCSGNTYIDPDNPTECLCPAGHVWSEDENTCIESICPEGFFESLENGCVPCDDESRYSLSLDDKRQKQVCKACGNRNAGWFNGTTHCYNMENPACTPGSSFRDMYGQCVSCSNSDYRIHIFETQDMIDLCNACPNRFAAGSGCILDTCTKGSQFFGYGKCYSCNTSESIEINSSKAFQDACTDCGNRKIVDKYCVKTTCDSNEFMGSDGQCYACTNPKKISVNTGSGCTSTTCDRQEVVSGNTTYCQIKNCPNDGAHVNVDGSCYPCDTTFTSTKSQCEQCSNPKRLWLGTDNADGTALGTCGKFCTKGVSYPYQYANACYACKTGYNGKGGAFSGSTETAREYCEACGGHIIGEMCIHKDSCNSGSQFRKAVHAYDFCADCGITNAQKIGTHEWERELCLKCETHKRFWAGEYCYRCDTADTPTVITEEERASCLSCTNMRKISDDDKCVLIQ